MADALEKDIDSVATELEKSTKTPMERVIDTIKKLGPAGVRAKLPTLEKAQKELLFSALEEMKKAVEMDADYQAKFVQGKITDTKLQEDKADDDQDEKLVKPEAAKFDHQGTPTPGWEGQVIKGKDMDKKDVKQVADKEAKKEVDQHEDKMHGKKCMKKSIESFSAVKKNESPEIVKKALVEIKKSVEDQLKEFGVEATPELIKGEIKRLLAEEDQEGDAPEMNEKTRANKENVAALNLAADSKEAQKKVNDEKQGQMKKSAVWGGENDLIKANTQGRNFHFSLEEYINEVSNAKPAEEIKKGFTEKKEDLNDIIEKGKDTTWGAIECDALVKGSKRTGQVMKSFADNEIAQALGLTEEEAKKILGE